MQMQHTEKGFTIQVASRRGKPVVSKGFVVIERGVYKMCNTVAIDILEEKFKRIA